MGMSMDMSMYSNDITNTNNSSTSSANTGQGGMSHGTMTTQNQQGNTMIVNTVRDILSNKQNLDNAIAAFKDSLSSLTLDPYSSSAGLSNISSGTSQTDNMGGMQMPSGTAMPDTTIPTDTSTNSMNGSTTVNIYPENNSAAKMQSISAVDMTMKDMGTRYDLNKMEQLHTGLYKLSIGMQILEQLNTEFSTQAEAVRAADTQNPTEYYSNQYTQVLHNKNKLNKALNYISEASNLVNINPYLSDSGIVYDKFRMMSVHDSIFKMAKGVAIIDQLNEELLKQALDASIDAQDSVNAANMSTMTSYTNQGNNDVTTGVLGNISIPSILNILLIAFVVLFVFGLLGAISSLFKSPKQNTK
jgi:hypothetical protein